MPERTGNLLVWGIEGIEPNTLEQAERLSRMPFIHGHVALMPDAHVGKGATVGSVIATRGAIIPAAIGVDIGCGMIAVHTQLSDNDLPDDLGPLHSMLAAAIPSGVGKGHERGRVMPTHLTAWDAQPEELIKSNKLWKKAGEQYGTLGSGNHFVELCVDENDDVWLVLHSGSRGVGNELASRHITEAKGIMKRYFIELEDPDLAYLVEGTPEFDAYIKAMLWSQAYALGNREAMMSAAMRELARFMDRALVSREWINCHHNFTQRENHYGKNLWLTRKGAIKAASGDRGVIPGSMGQATYIVTGTGSYASYNSSSHGAGRRLSRGAARRELTPESLTEAMLGKTWNDTDAQKLVDEHPLAYKDIDDVMRAQSDLVVVDHVLRQILNLKGT